MRNNYLPRGWRLGSDNWLWRKRLEENLSSPQIISPKTKKFTRETLLPLAYATASPTTRRSPPMPNEARVREIVERAIQTARKHPMASPQTIAESAARAIAALPVQVPAEWKMVPVEPTDEMLEALHSASRILCDPAKKSADIQNEREIWAAMLAASPPAPASQVLTEEDEQLLAACHGAIAARTCREPQVVSRLLAIIDRLTNKDAEHG